MDDHDHQDSVTNAAHEWQCPSCGAVTRARMADHQDVQDAAMLRLKTQMEAGWREARRLAELAGWFPFGTHADQVGVRVEVAGSDDAGDPLWVRPLRRSEEGDANHLRGLADWHDRYDAIYRSSGGSTEVQDDLRRIARFLDRLGYDGERDEWRLDPASQEHMACLVHQLDDVRAERDALAARLSDSGIPADTVSDDNPSAADRDELVRELEAFVEASLGECDYTTDGEGPGYELDEYERARKNILEMHRVLNVRIERLFQAHDQLKAVEESHLAWGEEAAHLEAQLANRPTREAYESACEALERRRVALVKALQNSQEGLGFYEAVASVTALVERQASAIVLPPDWRGRIDRMVLYSLSEDANDDPVTQAQRDDFNAGVDAVADLVESWIRNAQTHLPADTVLAGAARIAEFHGRPLQRYLDVPLAYQVLTAAGVVAESPTEVHGVDEQGEGHA